MEPSRLNIGAVLAATFDTLRAEWRLFLLIVVTTKGFYALRNTITAAGHNWPILVGRIQVTSYVGPSLITALWNVFAACLGVALFRALWRARTGMAPGEEAGVFD